jgi:hypothetical protein
MDDNEEFNEEDVTPEDMAEFIGAFMSAASQTEAVLRKNFCDTVVRRIYNDWGAEGFCELMVSMDKKAEWISDVLFESPDLADIAFTKYGIYDPDITLKARDTDAMLELNKKLWRLRRKYAKLIVDEIINKETQDNTNE